MSKYRAWQPQIRAEPLFNPFRPSADWTRDIGANDRIQIAPRRAAAKAHDLGRQQEERKDAA